MTEDEPDFLMSLNDTLTCGLGAAILLFLVFVVLVVLQEMPDGVGSLKSELPLLGTSINDTRFVGDEPLLVRIESTDCNFIKSLVLIGGTAITRNSLLSLAPRDKNGENKKTPKCVYLVNHLINKVNGNLLINATKRPNVEFSIYAIRGATILGQSEVIRANIRTGKWPESNTAHSIVRVHFNQPADNALQLPEYVKVISGDRL